ncbi:protein diaphanous homolog 1 [Xyrichtys novacula]|uniref:Protein diaphanous homolog 1 n=1 Tax=Xyrichtys novacula TaxID=13765 RepID=A0AAV1EWE6_XYRNO|nr:protein diaphanous homolog 1 [Xyrichtys novacula]
MMWRCVLLLSAVLSVESYHVRDQHERLNHGRQLKIYLPKSAEKLEFTPADEPGKNFLLWERGHSRVTRGRVSGTGSDRRWYIDKVTYEDQGTYTQRDYWNKEISNVKVAITPRHNFVKCIAGETLRISLEGLDLADSFLTFSGEAANVTLVRDGARVSQDIPEYWDRVRTHSMNIEILNVNVSDQGRYELRDRRDRVVSITRMDLTDHHEYADGNPLLALLLLLGIPAGVCCCCRKKIFKKKASMATTQQGSPVAVHPPPGPVGPVGPAPPYSSPGQPGGVYYHGPDPNMGPVVYPPPQPAAPQWVGPAPAPAPAPGFNPAYPPQNPSYPPAGPQWNGPPPAQFPPGPAAPMGYAPAPVMYSAPPAGGGSETKEELRMENMNPSPAEPLLTDKPQTDPTPASTDAPAPDGAFKFQIDGAKNTTNFL